MTLLARKADVRSESPAFHFLVAERVFVHSPVAKHRAAGTRKRPRVDGRAARGGQGIWQTQPWTWLFVTQTWPVGQGAAAVGSHIR
jgi:hypothetical protein